MLVVIMSYNRGEYLSNCISSIERNMPGFDVVIYDDNSNCHLTRSILAKLSTKYEICSATNSQKLASSHLRGLYFGMNCALEAAISKKYDYLFFIQDDQQVVRKVDDDFFIYLGDVFDADKTICQIVPVFFKGFVPEELLLKRFPIHQSRICYASLDYGMSDVGILHLERVALKQFRFQSSERQSAKIALNMGMTSVHAKDPFLMFTPWPGVQRKVDNLLVKMLFKLNQWGTKSGLNPFKDMKPSKIADLKERTIEAYPIAEEFLESENSLQKPWWFSDPFDIEKAKSFRYWINGSIIFDGPIEYINIKQKSKFHSKKKR